MSLDSQVVYANFGFKTLIINADSLREVRRLKNLRVFLKNLLELRQKESKQIFRNLHKHR